MKYQEFIKENQLKALREKRGLLKSALANTLELPSTSIITSWESGRTTPDIVQLFQLCKALGAMPHNLYPALFEKIVIGAPIPPDRKFKLGREAFLNYLIVMPFRENTYTGEDIPDDDDSYQQ